MEIKVLISREEIQSEIKKIAVKISRDYREVTTVTVLKGAWWFSELLRKELKLLNVKVKDKTMRVSSYGEKTENSGDIHLLLEPKGSLEDNHVIIVEDIVDTGLTVEFLQKYLSAKNPRSLKVCALLDKPDRRRVEVEIDYVGFRVPDKFLVGFGLDYKETLRELSYIGYIEKGSEGA